MHSQVTFSYQKINRSLIISCFFSCELNLDVKTIEIGQKHNFEVRGYSFDAKPEELRKPRIVRVGTDVN